MATVLLIEDEEALRDNVEIVLAHAGHAVITADNGRSGLARILNDKPDLVVCDISMPEMSGIELLDTLRRDHPERAELPFIFLSALTDRQAVVTGREHGADDYLTKPVDYELLKATIDSRLNRTKQATALKEQQFVRLFKKLSQGGQVAPPPEPDPDLEPYHHLHQLAQEPLSDRVALLALGQLIPDFQTLSPSIHKKFRQLLDHLVDSQTSSQDFKLRLGTDTWLVVLAEASAGTSASLIAHARESLQRAMRKLAQDEAAATPSAGADGTGDDGDSVNFRELIDTLERTEAAAQPGTPVPFALVKERFRLAYAPVWHPASQMVEAYRVDLRRRVGSNWLSEPPLLGGEESEAWLCELQAQVLEQAQEEILRQRAEQPPGSALSRILVPLSLRALGHIERYKVEQQLTDARHLLSSPEIGFLLTDLDPQLPVPALRQLLANLRQITPCIALDRGLGHPQAAALHSIGIEKLHFDLEPLRQLGFSPEITSRVLGEFLRSASKIGLETWVSGVTLSTDARLCTAAGCQWLGGRVVGEARGEAGQLFKLAQTKVFLIT